MKLSKENISFLDQHLIKKHGVVFMDIRLEILDHLASLLEQMEGSFEAVIPDFMEKQKEFIYQTNLQLNQSHSKSSVRLLFTSIFSLHFLLCYIILLLINFCIISIKSKEWFFYCFDTLPIIFPAPISILVLVTLFSSKRRSYSISFVSITNSVLLTYLFLFLPLIRKSDNVYSVVVFSFFLTLSIAYYYVYFFSVKHHTKIA
jgi:hypothetical protein